MDYCHYVTNGIVWLFGIVTSSNQVNHGPLFTKWIQ